MKRKIFTLITLFALATTLASPVLSQSSRPRKESRIRYHNGPVMLFSVHVYLIFYGDWANDFATQSTLTDFVASVGGTPYARINTTYPDGAGGTPNGGILWARNAIDPYSHGTNLTDADIADIVLNLFQSVGLPLDPQGIYFVIASDDVNAPGLCTDYCEFHDSQMMLGLNVPYVFIGNPRRCPSKCAAQLVGPNGDYAADAMINWIAHSISGTITNPFGNGWFDRLGRENSDKCMNMFGGAYQTPNGALANINLAGRDYLIQMNWVNVGNGYCAMGYP